jgi:hypothetical protein
MINGRSLLLMRKRFLKNRTKELSGFGVKAMSNKKSLVYFQSGGPTAVINCSLYGVIKEAEKHPEIEQYLRGPLWRRRLNR